MRAAFAEVDITPPIGTHKIGWLKDQVPDRVLDPLSARLAVFESEGEQVAFLGLDTLSLRWTTTQEIRRRVEERYGFPGARLMCAASHNHAGPAIAHCGDTPRDEGYLRLLVERLATAFGEALERLTPARLGCGHLAEVRLSANRRVVRRDGTVCTHGSLSSPDALYIEGPMDPELAVLGAWDRQGRLLGSVVNFSCHPTHHGDGPAFSAGYPGCLAREMAARGCPVTVFLNGACGNLSCSDPAGRPAPSMEDLGRILAEDAWSLLGAMPQREELRLTGAQATVELPYRRFDEAECRGEIPGAQRFVDPACYDRGIPRLLERIAARGTQPAEVQVLALGDWAYVSIPAEYFVEHQLRIKESAHPRHALVASCANGMVGYVPTRQAFERGGYETTFGATSRLAPEAGDLLADAALELIRSL